MTDKELIKILGEVLEVAESHLDYCWYGDSWERECANGAGLPLEIEEALKAYRKWKEK